MGRNSLKEIRQKEIIRAFYKIAKKEGLENASIAKVAKEMEINPSLIMHYFATKENLVYGLIEFILDKYLLIYNKEKKDGTDSLEALLQTINNIFSKKWNTFFDDGVSYSSYALTFRDKYLKKKYKYVLDILRLRLEELIAQCKNEGKLNIENPALIADLIYTISDGAYYYLCLTEDKKEYEEKLTMYMKQAISLLNIKTYALPQKDKLPQLQ